MLFVSWSRFVDSLAVPSSHKEAIRRVRAQIGMAKDPLTQPTVDGAVQLCWDSGTRVFDVDVFPDGTLEWFFRDRKTKEIAGTDDTRVPLPVLPQDAVRYLQRVLET